MTHARIAAFVLALAACGADRTAPASDDTPGSTAAGGAVTPVASGPPEPPKISPPVPGPTDAPHARACKAHDECTVVPTLPAADACCDVTVTAEAVTRAYLKFMETWRWSHCSAAHVCAPNALPGAQMAPACRVGRCVAGMCALACNDPSFEPDSEPGMPLP